MNLFPVTPSIRSRLTAQEYTLRKSLLDCLVAEPASTTAAAAGARLGWPAEQTADVMAGLVAKKLTAEDEQRRVLYAYPVSGAPTCHRVTLEDGRSLHAMCAIDALGCCFEFGQPVQIDAACYVCGAPLRMTASSATALASLPQDIYVTHVDLNKYDDWANNT